MGCSFFYIHCKALVFSLMNRVAGVVWIGLNSDFMCFSLIVRVFGGVSRKAVRRQYEGTTKAVGYQSRYLGCLFDTHITENATQIFHEDISVEETRAGSREYHGSTMAVPWEYRGSTAVLKINTSVLPRYSHGTAVAFAGRGSSATSNPHGIRPKIDSVRVTYWQSLAIVEIRSKTTRKEADKTGRLYII